jgi:hypothetical protein
MKQIAATSKGPRARLTGAVYLLYFLTAVFAEFSIGRTPVVYSDAANLTATACYIAVTLLLYRLFEPVSKSVSLIAAFLSLAGCAIQTLSIFHLVPSRSPLMFFGLYCVLIGYLIFESTFLPRALGLLMVFAGLGWLVFLSPALAKYLSPYVEVLGVLAEVLLMLWLLVFGVNIRRWTERAVVAVARDHSATT